MMKFCTSKKDVTETNTSVFDYDSAGISVNSKLNGFNAENLYFHYKGESDADQLIADLAPKILRFPGGTPANVYNIHGPGYGYRDADLNKMVEGTGPYKNAQKSIKRNRTETQRTSTVQNHAVDFVRLLKEVNADVLLVANLLGEDQDILDMIGFFDENGINIAGVELGNEYYLKAYWSAFPNVNSYIARAKKAASAIKSEYPSIRLGVVAASSSEIKNVSMKQKLYFDDWNETLGKEDFFDAFISHVYSKNKECDGEQGQSRFDCYLAHNSEFVREISGGFRSLSETFQNRPVWITEWNIKSVFDGLGNSTLQALYYADFALAMTSSPDIEIATYHNLLTSSTGYNMIAKDKSRPNAQAPSHVPRTVYPVARLLSEIFDEDFRRYSVPSNNIDPALLTLGLFKSEARELLFIVNK
ncbi:MAG: hypothetical protein HKO93_02280, partial [Flavobacteriales bacterium]|nr:hypothetical protein [Flavobacteriales bacterium]